MATRGIILLVFVASAHAVMLRPHKNKKHLLPDISQPANRRLTSQQVMTCVSGKGSMRLVSDEFDCKPSERIKVLNEGLKGYEKRENTQNIPDDGTGSSLAGCYSTSSQMVLGGGFWAYMPDTDEYDAEEVHLHGTYPTDENDGWMTTSNYEDDYSLALTSYALCADKEGSEDTILCIGRRGSLRYVINEFDCKPGERSYVINTEQGIAGYVKVSSIANIPEDGTGAANVQCPSGKKVISGGVNVFNADTDEFDPDYVYVLASRPTDNNDGWYGEGHYEDDYSATLQIWAICADTMESDDELLLCASGQGSLRRVSNHFYCKNNENELSIYTSSKVSGYEKITAVVNIPEDGVGQGIAQCTEGKKVVGGGFQVSNPDTDDFDPDYVHVLGSRPSDNADGWEVAVQNDGDYSMAAGLHAICAYVGS